MLGLSVSLACLFLLNGSLRLFSETIVSLDLDPTGEIDEQLNQIVSTIRSKNIQVIFELFLLLSSVVWIYFSGFILCAQLMFAGIALTFWPQRYFK
jgi:uncharacterized membrane protein YccF (DUF307 family)